MLLERSHEGVLVLRGLEATVTELGAGVDELQLDVLKSPALGVDQERLKEIGKALVTKRGHEASNLAIMTQ